MSKSKIEWTDETWNVVTGCTKVSAGCTHCYAERMSKRLAGRYGYPADKPFQVTLHPEKLAEPLKWKRPRRIFVNSMGDLFHPDVPTLFLADVFSVMEQAKQHTFMILTKRPEGMKWLRLNGPIVGREPLPNVWLGVSVENQATADERIPLLLQTPAAVRFISAEPLLGSVDLHIKGVDTTCRCAGCLDLAKSSPDMWQAQRIDWLIVGGETGPGARPMHQDWVRSLRDQCQTAGVPFFFKSWGDWSPIGLLATKSESIYLTNDGATMFCNEYATGEKPTLNPIRMAKIGKKESGRILDGRTWNEFPEVPNDKL